MVDTHVFTNLDYLIYSSHKSATQTIASTFRASGLHSLHCHMFSNFRMPQTSFLEVIKSYKQKNKKKLEVVSVFREPIARHISSFFQGYGTKPLRKKQLKNEFDTIIYKKSVHDLQAMFLNELSDRSLIGYNESLFEILSELSIDIDSLQFSTNQNINLIETEDVKLYIFRFDILIQNIESILSSLTGRAITVTSANMGNAKWYADIYKKFESSLHIPEKLIENIYQEKSGLIDLFYLEDKELLFKKTILKYR